MAESIIAEPRVSDQLDFNEEPAAPQEDFNENLAEAEYPAEADGGAGEWPAEAATGEEYPADAAAGEEWPAEGHAEHHAQEWAENAEEWPAEEHVAGEIPVEGGVHADGEAPVEVEAPDEGDEPKDGEKRQLDSRSPSKADGKKVPLFSAKATSVAKKDAKKEKDQGRGKKHGKDGKYGKDYGKEGYGKGDKYGYYAKGDKYGKYGYKDAKGKGKKADPHMMPYGPPVVQYAITADGRQIAVQMVPGAPAMVVPTADPLRPQQPIAPQRTLTPEQMKDFSLRRPEAYKKFTQCNISMTNGLYDITLARQCPEKFFTDFMDCVQCWLSKTLGEKGPYHLRKVDVSGNNLSNNALKILMTTFRSLEVRIDLLNLSGNCFDKLDELVTYIWDAEPLQAIGLKNNRLRAEDVNSVLRCCYNHESYPLKSADGRKFVPLRIELEGNPCVTDLPELFANVYKQGKVSIITDDAHTGDLPVDKALYLCVHVPKCCTWQPPKEEEKKRRKKDVDKKEPETKKRRVRDDDKKRTRDDVRDDDKKRGRDDSTVKRDRSRRREQK